MAFIEGSRGNRFKQVVGDSIAQTQVKSSYEELVYSGRVFYCANQSGVTSQAGLSGTTPVLTLFNPISSTVDLVVLFAGCQITVAAATAGMIWVGLHQATAAANAASAVGTVSANTRNALVQTSLAAGQGQCLLAGTATTPIAIASLGVMLTGAITTTDAQPTYGRFFDGSLILTPNSAISIQTGVASGASGLFCEYVWMERPISERP